MWRLVIVAAMLAWWFWVLNPTNNVNGLYQEGPFITQQDCETTRTWVKSVQPTPVASPSPGANTGLLVAPACVQMFNGSAK